MASSLRTILHGFQVDFLSLKQYGSYFEALENAGSVPEFIRFSINIKIKFMFISSTPI